MRRLRTAMPQQKIRSSSPFEFDGFWWLPGEGSSEDGAQGYFSWDPAEGGLLKIIDLRGDPATLGERPGPISVLHGCNLQGKPCTMFDPLPVSVESNIFGGHIKEILQTNQLIYGMHLQTIEELSVKDAVVSVKGLREWVNHRWMRPRENEDAPEVWVEDIFENDVFSVPLENGKLLLARGVADSEGQLVDDRDEATVQAQFHLDSPVAFDEFHEHYSEALLDLLILTAHQPSEILSETVLVPSDSIEWCGEERPRTSVDDVKVVQRTTLEPMPQTPHAFQQIPMPLRAWEGEAREVIGRWFALRPKLEGPGDLFFATLNKTHVDLQTDALSLLSAGEGYHRITRDDPPFCEEKHDAALEAMIGALGSSEQKEHYRGRLRYTNQQSQKQRLRMLFDRAEWILPEAESWRRKQLQALVDTRNFFVHWGERSDEVLEDWDLWAGINRLRIVLEINLFLDLCVDSDVIEIAIRMANRRRRFMAEA